METSALMKALRRQGIEEIYVKILEDIYKESTATIKLHKVSDRIPLLKGVKKDDTISLKLLMAALEKAYKNLEWEESEIHINGEYLNNLKFVDDIVIMSELTDELQQMILQLHRESHKVGLKTNMKKTKVMFNNYILDLKIKIDDEII